MRYYYMVFALLVSFFCSADVNVICNKKNDVSNKIQEKIDNHEDVHLSSGVCTVKHQIVLKDNTKIYGEPNKATVLIDNTVFKASQGMFFAYSESKSRQVNNVVIKDLTLDGGGRSKGFSEHVHLISLHGVSNVLIHNINFIAFRGDAVYLGGGIGTEERHNHSIYITSNNFDGVNNLNRNGVSVIDGVNVHILNNKFSHVAQSNMPGAIDIEPNRNKFHIVRNITVGNNYITDVIGYAAINIWLNDAVSNTPTMFYIYRNKIYASGSSRGISFEGNKILHKNSQDNNIIITSNEIYSNSAALILRGAKKFKVENNIFISKSIVPLLLNTNKNNYSFNGEILNNKFSSYSNLNFPQYFDIVSRLNCYYCVK